MRITLRYSDVILQLADSYKQEIMFTGTLYFLRVGRRRAQRPDGRCIAINIPRLALCLVAVFRVEQAVERMLADTKWTEYHSVDPYKGQR